MGARLGVGGYLDGCTKMEFWRKANALFAHFLPG